MIVPEKREVNCNLQTEKNPKQKRYTLLEKAMHAVYMLDREQIEEKRPNLTFYAEYHNISRTTLYEIKNEIEEGFSRNKPDPKKNEFQKQEIKIEAEKVIPLLDKELAEIENNLGRIAKKLSAQEQKRLLRTILQMAVTPASTKEIRDVLKEAFGIKISKSKIKALLNKYAKKARQILDNMGIEKLIEFLAVDEVFSGSQPILTGVELNSFAVVICETAFNRNHETWKRVLSRFENVKLVVSDQAKGIIKAVKLLEGVKHQWDIFHFKRDGNKLMRHLESQAYKKIDCEYKTLKRIETCKTEAKKEKLLCDYQKHKEEALKSINLFDEVEKAMKIIYQALDVFDSSGNITDPRKSLDKIHKACQRLERASSNKKIRNIAKRARDPQLLLYLSELKEKLLSFILLWNKGVPTTSRTKVIEIIAKHWYSRNQQSIKLSQREGENKSEWIDRRKALDTRLARKQLVNLCQMRYLQMALKDFDYVFKEIIDALNHVYRASSLVESWNSQVRVCQQVKKGLHRDFLALCVLRWNMTPFEEGKRKGKSPFQLLGLNLQKTDWLDLLLSPFSTENEPSSVQEGHTINKLVTLSA